MTEVKIFNVIYNLVVQETISSERLLEKNRQAKLRNEKQYYMKEAFIQQISQAEKYTLEFFIFLPMTFLMALVSLNSFFNS